MKRTALYGLVVTLAAVAPAAALAGLASGATAAETTATTTPATTTTAATPEPSAPATPTPATTTTATNAASAVAPELTIDVIAVSGSGCPAGTATVAFSRDRSSFRVLYGDYMASAGRNVSTTEGRKNCQLNLKVQSPSGYTYAIGTVEYGGTLDLAADSSAVTRAVYYFQGMSARTSTSRTINGPASGDWQNTDVAPTDSLVWQPCGEQRSLNISTELRVNKGSATNTSYISMDSIDRVEFVWRTC